jgi:hypothetical protein
MINANDDVKLKGSVLSTGTGTFTVAIDEFYVDGVWHKLTEAKNVDIAEADFTNDLTATELEAVKKMAETASTDTALSDCKKEVIDSIVKKLGGTVEV